MSGSLAGNSGTFDLVGRSKQPEGTVNVAEFYGLTDDKLSDDEIDVLEAERFIVYGKASIEQYDVDDPPQKIRMDAIEEKLPQFFANGGLISRRHKDVVVGEALREHELDEPTTIKLEDETLQFDAGDKLKTEVKGDTLWLAANIFSDRNDVRGSLLSDATRLGAYHGKLDGFSITVFTRDYDPTQKGQDVSGVDLFSVTIGDDGLVKNRGSEFDVATFKMFGPDGLKTKVNQYMSNRVFNHLFGKSRENLAHEAIKVAQKEEIPLDEAASQVVDDGDGSDIADEANEKLAGFKEKLDNLEEKEMDERELAAEVADMLGMSTGEVMEMFEQLQGESGEEGKQEEEYDEEDEGEEGMKSLTEEQKSEVEDIVSKSLEDTDFATEEQIQELGTKLEESLDGISEDLADNIASKMETEEGETQDPDTGGNGSDEIDVDEQMDDLVNQFEV